MTAYSCGENPQRWSYPSPPDRRISHGERSTGTVPADTAALPVNEDVWLNPSRELKSHSTATPDYSSTEAMNSPTSVVMVSRPESRGNDGSDHHTMRHGFGEAYSSEEYLTMLEQVRPVSI